MRALAYYSRTMGHSMSAMSVTGTITPVSSTVTPDVVACTTTVPAVTVTATAERTPDAVASVAAVPQVVPTRIPTNITDLRLWLRADNGPKDAGGATPDDNEAILNWLDSSGNSFTFTQATGSKQPLYKTNIINGLPVVQFDGTDDLLVRAANDVSTSSLGTFIAVFARDDTTPASQIVFSSCDEATVNTNEIYFWYTISNGRISSSVAAGGAAQSFNTTTTTMTDTVPIIHVLVSSGTAYTAWNNGTSQAATGTNDGDWFGDAGAARDNYVLGMRKATTELTGGALDGYIAEVIIIDHALTDNERESLENYLGLKYAITVA